MGTQDGGRHDDDSGWFGDVGTTTALEPGRDRARRTHGMERDNKKEHRDIHDIADLIEGCETSAAGPKTIYPRLGGKLGLAKRPKTSRLEPSPRFREARDSRKLTH